MSYILPIPYTELAPTSHNKGVTYSPRIPTVLEWKGARGTFLFPSVVDSGADYCVFPASFGERLGINIKSGEPSPMAGFGGGGHCYYHNINVLMLINNEFLSFKCHAGFSDLMNDPGIGLLGRHGFFELFEEVTFDQRNKIFKLKLPGEPAVNSTK